MLKTRDVVIVGGGLGGLSAALAVARAGVEVVVVEARTSPDADFWGLVIWPLGARTLRWLGLLDQVTANGCVLKAYRWYAADGREWASVDLGRMQRDGDFIGILPSSLVGILDRAAQSSGIEIVKGVQALSIERSDKNLRVHARLQDREVTLQTRLLLGADGPASPLRASFGLRSWHWRPPGQVIITGIAGALSFNELRQAMGVGWSGGCVSLGEKSWVYAITRLRDRDRGIQSIQAYAKVDPQVSQALEQLENVREIRPWSIRVRPWVADGFMLIGDAAHTILPHLGLGGSLTLEDVPSMASVVVDALAVGNTAAERLRDFERRRRRRISYACRISEFWALSMTSRLPGMRLMRDLNLWRISKKPRMIERFLQELAGTENPKLGTRLNVWLP